ncbi:type IV pilus biogenesis protein PilP [Pseudomonas sp. MAFF 301514]|uniref:Type IV pilus biogenesis protein PilP n=1 Tax=Pseudomonas allii TaxID=2740531 RepID=A0A7Y8UX84_9PSED|nr:type IV pilus biogenesis protein PilP [Pseudomonas allii]NWN46590.1 type IV pilus biogenesis protein PilP [Pseudomonas allii]NWN60770.1 type IV pilus biogenesis protein PilP [Pseudomonas allii]
MRNNPSVLFLTCWLPFTSALAAVPDLSGISVGELGKVQSETILFKAQAERTKAELEANGTIPNAPQPVGQFPTTGLTPTITATAPGPRLLALPVVKEISGSGQKLRASLIYGDGSEVDAKPGSELPNGFRVQQITLDGVVLSKEGKRYPLGFGSRVMIQPQQSLPGLMPGQP